MKASANVKPERLVKGRGKAQFNYNIKQVTVEEPDGRSRKAYEYDYVEITGEITKAKIINALEDSKLDIVEKINPDELESTYIDAKVTLGLSELSNRTPAQLNTYINNNVTDLASAKEYLKKLSKVVLALLKYLNAK